MIAKCEGNFIQNINVLYPTSPFTVLNHILNHVDEASQNSDLFLLYQAQ